MFKPVAMGAEEVEQGGGVGRDVGLGNAEMIAEMKQKATPIFRRSDAEREKGNLILTPVGLRPKRR